MKIRTRFAAAFMAVLMMMATAAVAFAAEPKRIDLGNGFYAVEDNTVVKHLRDSTVSTYKNVTVYLGGDKIGTFVLSAVFAYNETEVRVLSKSCVGEGANGWTASNAYAVGLADRVTGYCKYSNGYKSTEGQAFIRCDTTGRVY